MNTLIYSLASWLLVPVAFVQGLQVRARTPRLTPPPGLPFGQVGDKSPDYRLLVVGDSSAAGVGADSIDQTVGPQVAQILHAKTGQSVYWRNAGSNSAISQEIRDHVVPNLEHHPYTHIVVTVGTNDIKNFLTARRFKKGFGGLLYALRAKWPAAAIIWSPVIDLRTVPNLPPLLANILEMRAKIMNRLGRQLCAERYAIVAPQLQTMDASGFAVDGFHAGPTGYHAWAQLLATAIVEKAPLAGPDKG
ncbi:MAG: SGNH/GDSL hydrolase family protein [Rhizobiaceae bacterium]|nr:SGNH/GDSL hydrolase family protein [Rhizobiaceae bacterium]